MEENEIDLKEILLDFWNKKLQIILIISISILIGIMYTIAFVKPVYTSSTTLLKFNPHCPVTLLAASKS